MCLTVFPVYSAFGVVSSNGVLPIEDIERQNRLFCTRTTDRFLHFFTHINCATSVYIPNDSNLRRTTPHKNKYSSAKYDKYHSRTIHFLLSPLNAVYATRRNIWISNKTMSTRFSSPGKCLPCSISIHCQTGVCTDVCASYYTRWNVVSIIFLHFFWRVKLAAIPNRQTHLFACGGWHANR